MFFSHVRFGFKSMCVKFFSFLFVGKGRPGHLKFKLEHIKKILAKQVVLCFLPTSFLFEAMYQSILDQC